MMHGL